MDIKILPYILIFLFAVFISAVSQVILKKAALKTYDSYIKEYLNPMVIIAYMLFFGTTFLAILSYQWIPLSMGPILDSTSYIYVTIFGVKIFHEKMNPKKYLALGLIIIGILIYSLG